MPTAKATTPKTPAPAPSEIQVNDALEKARYRITAEFDQSSYKDIAELICKLMIRYTREEMKK